MAVSVDKPVTIRCDFHPPIKVQPPIDHGFIHTTRRNLKIFSRIWWDCIEATYVDFRGHLPPGSKRTKRLRKKRRKALHEFFMSDLTPA